MNKTCDICHKDGSYKCPTCLIFYCSLTCCKKHRQAKCDVVKFDSDDDEEEQVERKRKRKKHNNYYGSELEMPKNSEQGNGLVGNNHPRNLPVTIDEAENIEEILEKNEQQPIFESFAGFKVIEPQMEENEPQISEDTF